MKKLFIVVLMMGAVISSGCIASRKFVRNEVKTAADPLSARIDTTKGEIKETRDAVDLVDKRVTVVDEKVAGVDSRVTTVDGRVTNVDGRVTGLDTRTTEGLNTVKQTVSVVDAKTEKAMSNLNALDGKFQNRNSLEISREQSIQFKFDSAILDKSNMAQLDEIATAVTQNRDAIVVLEGRTDSTGDRDYNIALGERRVNQVRQYLATDKSVPIYRIHEVSFGAARPIAANDSREGREKNRSVTVTIMVPSADPAVARQ